MAKTRILVVEDEGIIAKDIKNTLESLGYAVTAVVSSGEDAIERTEATRPDLVLMDIVLKGTNGIEAANQIHDHLNIPVVYLTAYADDETLQRAKITEPYGYILKPFEERDFRATIETALYKHRMEKKLRESEQWLSVTLKSIGDAVIATDVNGLVTFMNPVAEALTGWQRDDAAGKHLQDIFHIVNEQTGMAVEDPAKKARAEGLVVGLANHTVLIAKDGTRRPLDDCAAPIKDEQGHMIGAVLIFRDITKQRNAVKEKERLEAQLRQAQKMEAVGRLAGGIAHDFNNLLTVIEGYADLALAKVDENHLLHADLDEIRKASVRASGLTRQLLLFSRQRPTKAVPLDVNEAINGLVNMLTRLLTENVTLTRRMAEGLWMVEGDPGSLEQVILNLVVNARDAMPQGGEIVVTTENVHVDEKLCEVCAQARPGDFVRVSVHDSGVGMDQDTMMHLAEPFFTTKKPGEGTGMGLAVAYGIIKQHGGWMHVESKPHVGSLFSAYLPATARPAEKERDKQVPPEDLWGKGERILLIEDNDAVQKFATRGLSEHGYTVFAAANAQEAEVIFEKEGGNFDLIFSDVVLPDESGPMVVERFLKRKPSITAVFTTGYSKGQTDWSIIEKGAYSYLLKPYSLSDMLAFLHNALQATEKKKA